MGAVSISGWISAAAWVALLLSGCASAQDVPGAVDPRRVELEQRVQRLEDIEEIRQLRFRYHRFINQRAFDRMSELFTQDAVIDVGKVQLRGRAQIRQSFIEFGKQHPLVMQFPHNHMVELAGATATGLSFFEARYARNGVPLMIAGSYEESYVRTDGRWLIQRMKLLIDFAVPPQVGWAGDQLNYLDPAVGYEDGKE